MIFYLKRDGSPKKRKVSEIVSKDPKEMFKQLFSAKEEEVQTNDSSNEDDSEPPNTLPIPHWIAYPGNGKCYLYLQNPPASHLKLDLRDEGKEIYLSFESKPEGEKQAKDMLASKLGCASFMFDESIFKFYGNATIPVKQLTGTPSVEYTDEKAGILLVSWILKKDTVVQF